MMKQTPQDLLKQQIEQIDLKENNIFLVRTLKNIQTSFLNDLKKNVDKEREEINKIASKRENEEELSKKEQEKLEAFESDKDNYFSSVKVYSNIKKFEKLSKISKKQFDLLKDSLSLFLVDDGKKQRIDISLITHYFNSVDTEAIEEGFLNGNLDVFNKDLSNSEEDLESKDIEIKGELTFNEKLQKLFSGIEQLTDKDSILKQMEQDMLESDMDYADLIEQKEQLMAQIKEAKERILSGTPLEAKREEIKADLKDEKMILGEFLEVSVENGDYKEISVLTKDGKQMKPKISVKLSEVKQKED